MKIDSQTGHVWLDIRAPEFYNDPYPFYHELRQRVPIFYWELHDLWAFTRHQDVDRILRDRRFGRQVSHVVSPQELGLPPERDDLKPFYDVDRFSMLDLEPPAHTRLRGLVHKAFMARQIERLRPRVTRLCHDLIDQMTAHRQVDLLPAYATPIPVTVIAEMLGVLAEMSQSLLDWSHAMDQLARWRKEPGLAETAVAELLRYDTPLHQFNRWVLEDLEYEGHHFRQGTRVSLLLGAANRDPDQFSDPDRLDLGRQKNAHVSFGGGIHYCLGAPLVRLELQIALPVLLARLPHLQLAAQPHYRNSYHFHGLEALWVTW